MKLIINTIEISEIINYNFVYYNTVICQRSQLMFLDLEGGEGVGAAWGGGGGWVRIKQTIPHYDFKVYSATLTSGFTANLYMYSSCSNLPEVNKLGE